jgi:hypothetical protein
MTTDTLSIAPLALKLAKILGQVGNVSKEGYNSHFKYRYVTESSLVDEIRPKLAEAGIFLFTSVIDQRTDGEITYVTTEHTFVDGESGACFSVQSRGQGADKGDKGGYKAITGAVKYMLYKTFMISTDDDPEHDANQPTASRTEQARDRQAAPRTNGSAPTRTAEPPAMTGDWHDAVVTFGKYKDVTLGEIARKDLAYLQWLQEKWTPKPKNDGTLWPDAIALQAALKASGSGATDPRAEAFVGEMKEVFEDDGPIF